MNENDSDPHLLARMASGSRPLAREALERLYQRHAPAVLSFISRLVTDMNDAEDILQETFLAASRNARRFRKGSALPWLLSIAASRLKTERRSRRRRDRREEVVAERKRPASFPDEGDLELELALARLPAGERAALDLRFQAGLEHREVARILGVSLRTAKTWSARGLEKLRAILGSDEEGGR